MNNRNVKIIDEHNIDRNASVMFAFDLEGSEYVTYWIERDEDNNNIFVSKIIKNLDATFNMLDIDDSMEKSKLSDIIKTLITTAVNSEADKLDGVSLTLSDGKVVKFISVAFNKEQRINVQKTYITTVKKEVTIITEKYYSVEILAEQPKISDDIFTTIDPVEEPVVLEPVMPTQSVEPIMEVKSNDEVTLNSEVTVPTDIPQVVPVVEQLPEEPKVELPEPTPVVVESITVAEPVVNVVTPEPVNVLPVSEPAPVVTPSVVSEQNNETSKPLVFNAAKETNLNAALGEVASSASIPVENIAPLREFDVDTSVNNSVSEPVVSEPVKSDVVPNEKSGFANSKFFIVVAVAFFLASCVFLGYEVYNYFQLSK